MSVNCETVGVIEQPLGTSDEVQPTFDISLRLKRWQKNQTKWNKGTSKIDNQINEYLKGKE